jgi:hypothetical protein
MESPAPVSPPGLTKPDPATRRFAPADLAVTAIVLLGLVGVSLVLVAHGAVFFSQWAGDLFIPMEGALHIRAGQWPHRDFVTPVGSLWYAIHVLPGLIVPFSARVTIWANLIVAMVTAFAALAVCLGRMPRWLAALCAFTIGVIALSPRQIGEDFQHISNNASYNRYCWALIGAIALAALLPAPGRRREWADGVVAGLLIAACFYIKVTYAAAGLGFLGLALVTTRGFAGWRFVAVAGSVALVTVLAAGIVTGDLPGYFADMHTAVVVLPNTARPIQARLLLEVGMPGLVLVGLTGLLVGARPDRLLDFFGPGLWAGSLAGLAGIVIAIQNHPEPENPLLPPALLICWVGARSRPGKPYRFAEWLGLVAVCIGFLFPLTTDLRAVGWTVVAPVDAGPATRWLAGTDVADLRIGTRFTATKVPPHPVIPVSDTQVLAGWDEAVGLLRPHIHGRHDAVVLPFIWSNPFPLMLGLPPVRHEVAWWDPMRTFNPAHSPDPVLLLGNVDFVLVPHHHIPGDTTEVMWAAYGTLVLRDFKPAGHTPQWDLWARRNCARRALC